MSNENVMTRLGGGNDNLLLSVNRWSWKSWFIYFTVWVILLTILAPYVHPFINLPLLAIIVLVVSSYIVHIWPKRMFYVDFVNERVTELKGAYLLILHVIFHVLPMTYIIVKYANDKRTHGLSATCTAVALMLMYIIFVNPQHVYGVPEGLLSGLIIMALCIYALARTFAQY